MAVYENVNGVIRQVNNIYENVNGVIRQVNARYQNVNGVIRQTYGSQVDYIDGNGYLKNGAIPQLVGGAGGTLTYEENKGVSIASFSKDYTTEIKNARWLRFNVPGGGGYSAFVSLLTNLSTSNIGKTIYIDKLLIFRYGSTDIWDTYKPRFGVMVIGGGSKTGSIYNDFDSTTETGNIYYLSTVCSARYYKNIKIVIPTMVPGYSVATTGIYYIRTSDLSTGSFYYCISGLYIK